MAQQGQGLAQLGLDKDHQVEGMTVQKEGRLWGVLEVVQCTFLLVLVQKAQWKGLHSVGVQMALKVEHLGCSKGWRWAKPEEVG